MLPINQNQALFSILGTIYGGNGTNNFALPDLRGRAPAHMGQSLIEGQRTGEEAHLLLISEMPAHNHLVFASSAAPNVGSPAGNEWAAQAGAYSTDTPNTTVASNAVLNVGGNQPHSNLQPFLVVNFIIALSGIFPSRN